MPHSSNTKIRIAPAQNLPAVESMIMGKEVTDKDRKLASRARRRLQQQLLRQRAQAASQQQIQRQMNKKIPDVPSVSMNEMLSAATTTAPNSTSSQRQSAATPLSRRDQ